MNKRAIFAALFAAATMGLSAQKPMNAPAGGKAISDELIGIFSMPNWYRTDPSSSLP